MIYINCINAENMKLKNSGDANNLLFTLFILKTIAYRPN